MRSKTCLRFPGGKFYGWKKIKPIIDIPHREYREPMVGGGSIFLGKQPVESNWINDLDSDLINFYKIIKNDSTRKELYELLSNDKANKKKHKLIKNMKSNDRVELAYYFFYLNRTSFSGIMVNPRWGYLKGSSVHPKRWIDIIEPVANKLQKVKITCQDFRKILEKKTRHSNKDVVLYVDPPYFKAATGIYKNHFTLQDHVDLMKLLKKTPYKFVLSYDNVREIRDMYEWAFLKADTWKYYMSEGRRTNGKELIITNFKNMI